MNFQYVQVLNKKIKMPLKIIKDEGPHFHYICDLWYLDDVLQTYNDYKYCLDIIDHFSKFLYSYLLFIFLIMEKVKFYNPIMEQNSKIKKLKFILKMKILNKYCQE